MNAQTLVVYRAYRAQRVTLRRQLAQTVETTYRSEADPDVILASYAVIAGQTAPVIIEGQRRTLITTGAFLRQLSLVQAGRLSEPVIPNVVGLTHKGLPILQGMTALGPMVLGAIKDGKPLNEALDFGRYLFTRFADAEVTRVADETVEAQFGRQTLVGWEGVLSGDPCPECQASNDGFHGLDEEMYRHGTCQCERVPVYGEAV